MSSSTVTLVTDFGSRDGYVGAMKGVILGINPAARVVDITHDVPAQDIGHAAFVLGTTCPYFPPDTVHVAVVDPGVGTSRRALLVVTPGGRFVVPDNGLLTYVAEPHLRALAKTGATLRTGAGFMEPFTATLPSGWSAWELTESTYWRSTVSDTFHGRDVFSPVAAHLSLGVKPDSLGRRVEDLICVRVFKNETHDAGLYGRVVFVDRFGNLVTNVRPSQLPGGDVEVDVGGASIAGLRRSYADGKGLRVLVGSHGFLEIAEKNGSAATRLSAAVGTRVMVRPG
jgi:S-adenosylmethionine hydrolase